MTLSRTKTAKLANSAAAHCTSLLDPFVLPCFDEITPDLILASLDKAIAARRVVIEQLIAEQSLKYERVWLPFEHANTVINTFWSTISHLNAVVDNPDLRMAFATGEVQLAQDWVEIIENRQLYNVFVALSLSPEFASRTQADRVAVERCIRGFTLSGALLERDACKQFRENIVKLSTLTTEFGNAVRDATDAWAELVTDEKRLVGISQADKAMFQGAANAKGVKGWLITLQQPSVMAVMKSAEDRNLRELVYRAYSTRASEKGPHGGQFDNSQRIKKILTLRQENAKHLGFAHYPAWSLVTNMAKDADEVMAFLHNIAHRAKPIAEQEATELRTYAAENLQIYDLQSWDVSFVAERLRAERYGIDDHTIRAYFPIASVIEGWKVLLGRLFGIRLVARDNISLWHDDARYFDVVNDNNNEVIAGLYLDLHSRMGKRGGAWMSSARPRLQYREKQRVPVAYLVCNFAPSGGSTPPLLDHSDIRTLLHETGHCLHHILTQVDRPSIAGTAGIEWDAIEFPSQIMEDFAWDREVLTSMSCHHSSGETLPDQFCDVVLSTRSFLSGLSVIRQVEYALFDMALHLSAIGTDPVTVMEAVRDEVAVIRPPAWDRFPHAFTHIFAGSYASNYYSYLWAEVLAADGFQQFVEAGLLDRTTGGILRDEVLSRGAVRPAIESFRAFRGRKPDPQAFLLRRNLISKDFMSSVKG